MSHGSATCGNLYRSLLLLFLGVFVACAETERPAEPAASTQASGEGAVAVLTDQRRYVLRDGPFGPETTIHTTFNAPADRDVYLLNCNGAFTLGLQRLDGATWVNVWASEINGCFSPPIVIPSGGRLAGVMTVASGADAVVSSRRTERRIGAGTYRAVWHGLLTSFDRDARPPGGEEIPLESRVSAPFVIEVEPPRDAAASSPAQRPEEITVDPPHGTRATRRAKILVHLADNFPLVGTPHLYVDGEPVDQAPGTASEGTNRAVEYIPRQPWSAGLHRARVIYQNEARDTRWYAWSFQVE